MKARVFCENIFNELLPSIRAIVSNRLTNIYGMTQTEVSKKLGLTQPAVSQYNTGLRGKGIKKILSNREMVSYIDSLSAEIVSGSADINFKVCEICQRSREDGVFSKENLSKLICLLDVAKAR